MYNRDPFFAQLVLQLSFLITLICLCGICSWASAPAVKESIFNNFGVDFRRSLSDLHVVKEPVLQSPDLETVKEDEDDDDDEYDDNDRHDADNKEVGFCLVHIVI